MLRSDMLKFDYNAVQLAFEEKYGKQPEPSTCCCYTGGYDIYFCEFCDWRRRLDRVQSAAYFQAKCQYENILNKIGERVTAEHLQFLKVASDFTPENLSMTRNMLYELYDILEPLAKHKQ